VFTKTTRITMSTNTTNNTSKDDEKTINKTLPSRDTRRHDASDYLLPHPIWSNEYLEAVQITHVQPTDLSSKVAHRLIKIMRFNFDWMSGFMFGQRTESKWLTRIIFLESVAAIPGSVAAILRHLASLRRFRRDHGWIHTLLEEAENERMHLMIAIKLKRPSPLLHLTVFLFQGIFYNFFFLMYLVSPRFCHYFVGYLEEEAVKTYTKCLSDIDLGKLPRWKTEKAPEIARNYWHLSETATIRDMIANYRADEALHREVNFDFANLPANRDNPYKPGALKL